MERLDISKASVSMNMRTLEHLGMVRQVWVRGRGGRRKYYEAETNYWQVITGILNGREMRDVERAIAVMEENSQNLAKSMQQMTAEEQAAARLYTERMVQLQALFQFARVLISSILAQADHTDLTDVSGIELQR
jgi:DNA-binding transcriptional regulator GbsR (MarR family)